ncbi:unnamed protein product [Calypogeia fissa]
MSSIMSITALSPLSRGNSGVYKIDRPRIADCNSRKLDNSRCRKFLKEQKNAPTVHASNFVTGTEYLGILDSSKFPLGTKVRRGRSSVERRAVTAMAKTQSGGDSRSTQESPAAVLRRILKTPGVHQGPACFDALSARLVEQAGFGYAFMSGFAVSAVRLGAPDVGLLSYGEVLDQGRLITSAVSIPVIGDADNGYGNALNVKRTVKGFMQAGFAGIIIEDQVSPKSCGHFGGKLVVSREEALTRIKAAVDARSEASGDIVIIARSDARQAESLEEALWRVQKFAELGADVLFIDALASRDEMLAFCKVASNTPKMANMLEGGGRTPILTPLELEEMGFKLVAYPLSLVGVAVRAMQDALKALKSGRLPPPGNLPSFREMKDVVGINEYYEEDERYAAMTFQTASTAQKGPDVFADAEGSQPFSSDSQGIDGESINSIPKGDVVDLYDIQGNAATQEDSVVLNPDILVDDETSSSRGTLSNIWSRTLRIKITGSTGSVKLDVRIPAGFLDGLSSTIPGVAGFNVRTLLDDALSKMKGNLGSGQQLVDFTDGRGERIQVFLE